MLATAAPGSTAAIAVIVAVAGCAVWLLVFALSRRRR
jgi:hypothetical protein